MQSPLKLRTSIVTTERPIAEVFIANLLDELDQLTRRITGMDALSSILTGAASQ
jgi:hypothetical protein